MPVVRELTTRLGYKVDSKNMKKYDGQLGKLTMSLGALTTAALAAGVAIAGLGAKAFVGKLVETSISFEKMKASLETVTGSAENANKAFAFIQQFAATTPFSLAEVSQAFIKLKSLGIEPTEERLKSFGNTASAMGKPLEQFIEAVADAATGEFERLKEFGIKARKEGDKVKFTFQGVTTEVKNDAESITKYLTSIGKGQFAGAMAKQMNTLGGIISNIKDNATKFLIAVGKGGFNDALRDLLKTIRDLQSGSESMGTKIGQALGWVVSKITQLVKWIAKNKDSIKRWGEAWLRVQVPIISIIAAIMDLWDLLSGKTSFIERFLGPGAADAIREIAAFIRRNVLATFRALRKISKELIPVMFDQWHKLQPVFKDLVKTGTKFVNEVLKPFRDTSEEIGLVELLVASIPLLKFMTRLLAGVVRFVTLNLTGWLRFATVVMPIVRVAWMMFVANFKGGLEQMKINWNLTTTLMQNQWQTTIDFLRGFWALLNGDILGAISSWEAAINRVIESLRMVGVDVSSVSAAMNKAAQIRSAVTGGPVGGPSPAAGATAGAGAGTKSLTQQVTSSIGSLVVQITGSTNMGPDQVAGAVKGGAGAALKDNLADATRNSAGAVT